MRNQPCARDVMNTDLIRVGEDMTVGELATLLTENEISGAPVENRTGTLVGVVSLTDIALASADRTEVLADSSGDFYSEDWQGKLNDEDLLNLHLEKNRLLVRDIMTPTVFSVPEETLLQEVARTMIAGRLHRLFVTRNDSVVGIVTTLDLLSVMAEPDRWDEYE